ncbi:MAG: ABC transporter ATP-binding protein [Pirellulales bacterium]|nr:ABC transporter ATP-binding protein [Pirellulales bacterium]
MAFLELHNLAKSYGRVQALRDVSLRLEPGAIGLVGNNGAGKSTLLKVLLGLLRPDAGDGSILDLSILHETARVRGLVGYMPEITATVPLLKGAEFVTLSGDLYGMPHREARRRAHEVLNYVGLGELRYRRLDEYSSGNLQRLKLAAALVHDPQLLLLDEPTNGLDPSGRTAMLRTVEDLIAETGKSVILCTHLLGDVERICEQIVVLREGTVILSGKMDNLKQATSRCYDLMWDGDGTEFVRALKRAGTEISTLSTRSNSPNSLHATQDPETDTKSENSSPSIQGSRNLRGRNANTIRVTVERDWATHSFFQMAKESGIILRRLKPVEENLHDLFLRVTAHDSLDQFRGLPSPALELGESNSHDSA